MTTLHKAAQQALEAMEYHVAPPSASTWRTTAAITALRAALAQQAEPVQEPVAWIHRQDDFWEFGCQRLTDGEKARGWTEEPLYRAPPQRKPLSLTDLQEALVLTNLIDRDAIDDPEEYDEGSTLAQIDELHRIIKE